MPETPSTIEIGYPSQGDHICFIYETEKQHREVVTEFIRSGLENGETVLYVTLDASAAVVLDILMEYGLDLGTYLETGHFRILGPHEFHGDDGRFSPDSMIDLLRKTTAKALKQGFTGLRVTGDQTGELESNDGCEKVLEYEAELSRFLPQARCLVLCQYDRRASASDELLDVLAAHRRVYVGTELCENPHHVPAQELLGPGGADAKLDYCLNMVRSEKRKKGRNPEGDGSIQLKLTALKSRYRAVIEQVGGPYFEIDPSGIFVTVNDAACRELDLAEKRLLGKNFRELINEEASAQLNELARHVLEHDEPAMLDDWAVELREGRESRFQLSLSLLRDSEGRPMGFSGMCRDITDRKAAEKALRRSEGRYRKLYEESKRRGELYRSVLSSAPDGVIVYDIDGKVEYVSPSFTRLFGWTSEEVKGARLPFVPESEQAPSDAVIRHIMETGEPVSGFETKRLTSDGRLVDVMVSASRYHDHLGNPLGLVVVQTDITKSKRNAEKLTVELDKFRVLYDLAVAMTAEKSIDENLRLVVESSRELLKTDTSFIALWDEETQNMYMHTLSGIKTEPFKALRIPMGKGLGGKVAETLHPHIIEDYFREVGPQFHEQVRGEGLISCLAVPIQVGGNHIGVLYAFNRTRTHFTQSDLDTLSLFGNLAALEISRSRVEEALRRSEQLFRAVFEGAEDVIFVKDRKRRFKLVNPSMELLWGLKARDFHGTTGEKIFGKREAKHSEEIDLRVLNGESLEMEHTRVVNGVSLTFLDIRVPLRNASGEITGVCGIWRNITERKRVGCPRVINKKNYPSVAMRTTHEKARYAASGDSIILLQGDSGSGKDYLARWIHDHSKRASGPFFSINCAALAQDLAESELFGHERGAFTGAASRKKGLLELAEGGTLLLNEIGELPLLLQAKLLTFLDSKSFMRVGGEKSIHINARLIAATHRDLLTEVKEGRFLKPLFYRLDVFSIRVPPLRERIEDIPILVHDIVARLAVDMQLQEVPTVVPSSLIPLTRYLWPGNIRELRNVIERSLILSGSDKLFLEPPRMNEDPAEWMYKVHFTPGRTLREITDSVTEAVCREAIRRTGGNKSKAASQLGISRAHLYRFLERFN